MTRKEFETLVRNALKKLPKKFKNKLQNIDFVIEEELTVDMAKKLGVGAKGHLLGLYQGVPLKDRTQYYGMVLPDKVTLYKQNIERECEERGLDVSKEVRHIIQHEIAHHFGISDKRLKDLGVY